MSNESWVDVARGFLPGVPATDMLDGSGAGEGAVTLPSTLLTAVAAAAYRLKNGQSVVIQVPFTRPEDLSSIAAYLHACRMDALLGKVRTTWMSRQNMACSQDLLVWTRARSQKKWMNAHPMLQAHFVGLKRDIQEVQDALTDRDRVLRTIVCQQNSSTRGFAEELRRSVSPFAIIVDATPFGVRDDLVILHDILTENFRGTPILWVAAAGDADVEWDFKEITQSSPLPIWRAGHRDPVLWKKSSRQSWQGKIAHLPDNRLNERLCLALHHIETLGENIPERQKPGSYRLLKRVWKTLLSLTVPVSFYELQADIGRRGGLFAFNPMSEWIEEASGQKLSSGDAQETLEKACTLLKDILVMLEKGTAGRQQALVKWVDEALGRKALLAMGSKRDADMLRKWLLLNYAPYIDTGTLEVVGAGSSMEAYRLRGEYDAVLLVGSLWRSDLWIAAMGEKVTWLAYPCELAYMQRWSTNLRNLDHSVNDKESWWYFLDTPSDSIHETPLQTEDWTDCSGQYVDDTPFQADLPEDPNWMLTLLKGFDWDKPEPKEAELPIVGDHVLIRTDEQSYTFAPDERLDVFTEDPGKQDEAVQCKQAVEVREGDILLIDREAAAGERSLLDLIMEHQQENAVEHQFRQSNADRWLDYLDHALAQAGGDPKKLHEALSELGVTFQTIKNWVSRTTTPQARKKTIPLVAKISGIKFSRDTLALIIDSMEKIQGSRIKAGKALHAAKTAIAAGANEATVGGVDLPVDFIMDILSFEEVRAITHHIGESEDEGPLSLYESCMGIVANSNGKIVVTKLGMKSLKDSPFDDHARVIRCFELIRDELYEVYANGRGLQETISILNRAKIDFTPGTSGQSQGRNKQQYDRKFNGKRVDIGKHLGMGDSYSPERCFRLHFHWADDEQAVVIHHAGRHLPTVTG